MSTHVAVPPTLDGRATERVGDVATWVAARWVWVLLGLGLATGIVLFGLHLGESHQDAAQMLLWLGSPAVVALVAAWVYAGRGGA